jgi:hypothetical protein
MKKIWIFVIVLIIVVVAGILVFYEFNRGVILQKSQCHFDNQTFDLKCSKELRVFLGFDKEILKKYYECAMINLEYDCTLIKEYPITDDIPYVNVSEITEEDLDCRQISKKKECYYKPPVYSEDSSINLKEKITDSDYEKKLGDILKNESLLFTSHSYFSYRVIKVIDVETGKEFVFYVSDTGKYDVMVDNSHERFLQGCNSGDSEDDRGSLCLPKGFHHWRCEQGYYPVDDCEELIKLINEKNLGVGVCYNIKYPDAVAYCLPSIKCFEYAKNNETLREICSYKRCKEKNEKDPCYEEYFGEEE